MIHKKGVENINADVLSRANQLDEPYLAENAKYQVENSRRNQDYICCRPRSRSGGIN